MAASGVDYLKNIGLTVPSGSGVGPTVLTKQSVQAVNGAASQNGSAAASVNGSGGGAARATANMYCYPCDKPLPGFAKDLVVRDGHPAWYQPTAGESVGLRATNSVTGEREEFFPLEGKKVRWYTCGPTVYDVAHMGHARAYLTFDILRRIMTDFFKYDVRYQINITDIDDKIILRSRQNKLLADFTEEAEGMSCEKLGQVVDDAVAAAEKKLQAKRPEQPAATASEKDKAEYDKLFSEWELKMGQQVQLKDSVAAAKGSKEKLLAAAKDPLMAKLDKERGHTVTDHAIFDAHSRHYEREFFEDCDALGVLKPDVVTRISDYMDGRVQKFIEKLERDNFAYASAGSVYFSIDEFTKRGYAYRKIVPANCCTAAEMEEGEGALAAGDGDKRNPNDFALWKKSKPGEPAWESKWGPGRPGWHIECSVMATDINGEFLDIHGGGEDLKFPHHDNEQAQTEAYLGRPQWTNYWWHAGHLHIQGLKMSKSLKNFITIRQALKEHSARQLRLMFLMQQWDKGMNYSDAAIDMARAEEKKLKRLVGCLQFFKRRENGSAVSGKREADLAATLAKCKEGVEVALKDNFNTSKAVDQVSRLIGECDNSFASFPECSLEPVCQVRDFVVEFMGMLGVQNLSITREKEAEWTAALDALAGLREEVRKLAKDKADMAKVTQAVENAKPAVAAAAAAGLDDCARAFEQFLKDLGDCKKPADLLSRCDEVRDKDCAALGVRLEDGHKHLGFIWMFDDPAVLAREAKDAEDKKGQAARQKLQNTLNAKQQTLKSAEKNAVPPTELFKQGAHAGLYAEFDENGVPTKLASGDELSKAKVKDFNKQITKQKGEYEKLQKQAGSDGIEAYVASLQKEVSDLEAQLKPAAS